MFATCARLTAQPEGSQDVTKMQRWSIIGSAATALPFLVAALFFLFTGPQDASQFPPPEQSPYLLPWPENVRYFCVQGVRGVVSHRGGSQFAYDFYMPIGSDICAARAGRVTKVVQHYDGNGRNWPNNVVYVDHGDGTRACYAHIKQNGSYVAEGDMVEQRQTIAASGNVGNSMMPHLHFHVTDVEARRTIPVTFADVKKDKGIPRMFKWYTSGKGQ